MRRFHAVTALAVVSLVTSLGCAPEEEEEWVPRRGGGGGSGSSSSSLPPASRVLLGGTLTLAEAAKYAVVSHPDRDQVTVVDLATETIRGRVSFSAGSVPTRALSDEGRRIAYVLLRGTGQIATISLSTPALLSVRGVCSTPRSLARAGTDLLVACETGELVRIANTGIQTVQHLGVELRDVLVRPEGVSVTTFRSAELLDVSPDAGTTETHAISKASFGPGQFSPQVAWRSFQVGKRTVMVHQFAVDGDISAMNTSATGTVPYYRNPCGSSIVRSAVSVFDDGVFTGSREFPGVLPMDAALSPGGRSIFVASTGNSEIAEVPLENFSPTGVATCGSLAAAAPTRELADPLEQPTGIAVTSEGALVIHGSRANTLIIRRNRMADVTISLGPKVAETAGSRLFHVATSAAIACASCHPEGQEDGHTWTLLQRKRRTQALSGGLLASAPFHWEGDFNDLKEVMDVTYVERMGGTLPSQADVRSLEAMLDVIDAPKPFVLPQRPVMTTGRAAFEKARCDSCHAGTALTNHLTMNVGTGGAFQTPSLIGVGRRGPWMHDGCAKTLTDRFDPACGGSNHGSISALSVAERASLIEYLGQL